VVTLTRRELLAALSAGAALAGCSSGPGPVPQTPWEPQEPLDADAFPSGVQVGDATDSGAIVSVRAPQAAATLRLARATDAGWVEERLDAPLSFSDRVAQHSLVDLRADTTYAVVAITSDGAARSAVAQLRTALAPGASRRLRFAATSCLGGSTPWASLSHAAALELDAFLLLGDTIYADWGQGDVEAHWDAALTTQGLLDVFARTSIVATWDDHEVGNNWDPASPADQALAQAARVAYRRALPQGVGPTGGIWRSLRWGDAAELFVLDCRGERQGSSYVSAEQLSWLIDGLITSPARFKIVLNSVPITDFSAFGNPGRIGEEDRWQGYPEQRTELLTRLHDAAVPGLLWVAGDFHVGGVLHVDADGGVGADMREVLVGPGGSPISNRYDLVPETGPIEAIVREWNTVVLELDPNSGWVTVVFVGDDGGELRRLILQL